MLLNDLWVHCWSTTNMVIMLKKIILDNAHNALLDLINSGRFSRIKKSMTLQEVADEIWLKSPQAVKWKLKQLEDKGYIRYDEEWEYKALSVAIPDIVYFPLLGFAQCWNLQGRHISDMTNVEKMPFPTKILSFITNSPEELQKYFLIRADGDSMEPDIKEWDIVLIKEQKECFPSDNTLIIHNGIPKIKQIVNLWNAGWVLMSKNPAHQPVHIKEGDELFIVGIVKQAIVAL